MKIAVTGINNVDSPGPGVPVIRGLKDSESINAEIIGLSYDTLEPGGYMPGITDKVYLIPYPSGGIENTFERISFIHSKEKFNVLIPTLDSELYGFLKLTDRLSSLGIKTFLPTFDNLNLRAKDKLFDFCTANTIKVPKNILVSGTNDLHRISSEFEYPVVVKGIFYDAYIANNLEEVQSAFKKLASRWGLPIIIQEFIKGDEYNVVALGDGSGETIAAVPMKKTYITDKGKAWAGITIDDEYLLNLVRHAVERLKWKSGAEFEFIKDGETNQYYLVEINPRLPAWVYLAVGAGQNIPEALLKLAIGEKIKPMTEYKTGTIFIRYSWDLITDIKTFESLAVKGEKDNKSLKN